MSRKLVRKSKKRSINDKKRASLSENESTEETKDDSEKSLKKIKKFKKQRCAFVDENRERCTNNAVGKSTLCKQHGGNPIIKENLRSDNELYISSYFDPSYHPITFIEMSREGMSEVEIAASFEVGLETMRGWSEKYASFNVALDVGRAMHEAWWLEQGKGNLNNRGFNTGLFKYLTANKLGYSDKMETKNMNMNVHGVLMIPDKMSEDEWENQNEDIIDVDS